MAERGGESPCPACGTPLRFHPAPARRRSRRRPASDYPRGAAVPVWVWPVAAFLLVFVLGGGVLLGLRLLKPAGRTVLGGPSLAYADLDKVEEGMSPDQVRAVLGRPTEEHDNTAANAVFGAAFKDPKAAKLPRFRIMLWTDERSYSAVVYFMNEQALVWYWFNRPPNRSVDFEHWFDDGNPPRQFGPGGGRH